MIKYFYFQMHNVLILANRILPLMPASAAFLPHVLLFIKPLKLNIKSIEIPVLYVCAETRPFVTPSIIVNRSVENPGRVRERLR